jgi:hypothetical protein
MHRRDAECAEESQGVKLGQHREMRVRICRLLRLAFLAGVAALPLCGVTEAKGKTVYVHLLNGDDLSGDGKGGGR